MSLQQINPVPACLPEFFAIQPQMHFFLIREKDILQNQTSVNCASSLSVPLKNTSEISIALSILL